MTKSNDSISCIWYYVCVGFVNMSEIKGEVSYLTGKKCNVQKVTKC